MVHWPGWKYAPFGNQEVKIAFFDAGDYRINNVVVILRKLDDTIKSAATILY